MPATTYRMFIAVAQERSFSLAAERLGITKSTISRRIARLEEQLSTDLIRRSTRSLELTPAGTLFLRRAERIVAEIELAEREIRSLQDHPNGPLRISLPESSCNGLLGTLIAEFMEQWPDIQVEALFTNRCVDLIQDQIDIALRAGNLADSSLIARRLYDDPTICVATPTYFKHHGTPQTVQDLEHHRLLLYRLTTQGQPYPPALQDIFGYTPSGALICNDFAMLHKAVQHHQGIAIIPSLFAWESCVNGSIRIILPELDLPKTRISLVYPSQHRPSPNARVFIDFATQFIKHVKPHVYTLHTPPNLP